MKKIESKDKTKIEFAMLRKAQHMVEKSEISKWIGSQGWKQGSIEYDLINNGSINLIQKLKNCKTFLTTLKDPLNDKIRFSSNYSCEVSLLCPLCAAKRAAKYTVTYFQKFIVLEKRNPMLRLYFLVLTIKNGEDLTERYNFLNTGLKKLLKVRREGKSFQKGGKKGLKYAQDNPFAGILAGVYSFEAKRGKNSQLWHPHVNLILVAEKPINYKRLKANWNLITGDNSNLKCILVNQEKEFKTFLETCKYALKFNEMNHKDNFTAFCQLKGKRLFGSFGAFRGLKIDKDDGAKNDEVVLCRHQFDGKTFKIINK